MTDSQGFILLPNVVSGVLLQRLAADMDANMCKTTPTVRREKFNEYEVPSSGYAVKDEFVQNVDKSRLASLFHLNSFPEHPWSINMGVFHETEADPSKLKTANKEEVYVTIAVTDLGSHNGWFNFHEGSHLRKPPLGKAISLNLRAGDAVAWSGNLVYSHVSGGGGKFLTIVYR
ncbi:hypothetical protein BDV27DRAFT_129295 [Aspergillus caelatus]|uniref:Alpha-ketoglutarate-dependent dioxygenase AlkB-like domain-containing protein n=1 Tax=Aspergillus caelatus TaxID=61420 RepID=A0A5N7A392_9EURO|nr:uncharacterized protein BDV27DRAFT_129295 [Aspergillus caelatus]KAE8363898.1 hypothetical protein BDV27DRAFT_129295 [Aspergillus caelatus]